MRKNNHCFVRLAQTLLLVILAMFNSGGICLAGDSAACLIEESMPLPTAKGNLGTSNYIVNEQEKPFFSKLSEDDRITGSILKSYSLEGKQGKYVSWCGIVRSIEHNSKKTKTL